MHLFLKGWIYKLNILFNYMGTDGAGRLIALSLAKAMKKNKCNVYAVLSANVAGNEEWISEFGKKNICFVTNYQNKNKIDFASIDNAELSQKNVSSLGAYDRKRYKL